MVDEYSPLLDAIAANRDDDTVWAVFADQLESAGHPRGELMSLMLERERTQSARLLSVQGRLLTTHAARLKPIELPIGNVVGWRRGFVSELRLTSPVQIEHAQRDRSLQFVERAILKIELDAWRAWDTTLRAAKLPWRRLRVELTGEGEVAVAALVACCPALATLHIVIAGELELDWTGASAPELEQLVLENAGEVGSLDAAELPRIEELRLLDGSTPADDLQTSLLWSRLKRAIVSEPSDAVTRAFMVVGRDIDAALLRKLVAIMSIAHLSARIATMRWLPRPVTVIALHGTEEMLPYRVAVALRNVLAGAPIVLAETSASQARFLVLGETETRATQSNPAGAMRRALDLAFGQDLGSTFLDEIYEHLDATPVECLVGRGGDALLAMIDPLSASIAELEEDESEETDEDEDHDDEGSYDEDDGYEDFDHDDYDGQVASYEEPPAPQHEPPATKREIEAVADVLDEPEAEAIEDEDALSVQPEREEHWLDFRDHWTDRAVAADDEDGEARWPDPERPVEALDVIERQVAEPECVKHRRAFEHCKQCSELLCPECVGEDYCAPCFAALTDAGPSAGRSASDDSQAG